MCTYYIVGGIQRGKLVQYQFVKFIFTIPVDYLHIIVCVVFMVTVL